MRVSHRDAGWLELSTPLPKRATDRGVSTDTLSSTLSVLKVQVADSDELYKAMDPLSEPQQEIEQSLAAKYLWKGSLILTRCDFHLF